MLPVEQNSAGQIWLRDQFLCNAGYAIGEPMRRTGTLRVQRIILTLEDEHSLTLLDSYSLSLVLEDGSRHSIPRPLQSIGLGRLECYVESRR